MQQKLLDRSCIFPSHLPYVAITMHTIAAFKHDTVDRCWIVHGVSHMAPGKGQDGPPQASAILPGHSPLLTVSA
jgi:hypothetical protein